METRQGLPASQRPRTSPRSFRAGYFVLFLFACIPLASCASPGEPIERKPPVPQPVSDLTAMQAGNSVVLTFTLPKETVDRRSLDHPPAIEIFRELESDTRALPAHPAPHASIPSSVVDNFAEQDRIRYADPLQPEDFTQHPDGAFVYVVRTRASAKKESADSNPVTVHIHPAAEPIEDMKAEVTHTGIQITWTAPQKTPVGPVPPVASYRVYRTELQPAGTQVSPAPATPANPTAAAGVPGAKPIAPLLKIGEVKSAGYLDTQFDLGKTYVYTVRSVVQYGEDQIESAGSNPFTVLARDISPPDAPRGLIVVYVPSQSDVTAHLELSWSISPETDLAGYNVYRSEQAGVGGTRLNPELLHAPAFRDMNAVPGRTYFYSITAMDRSGNESPAGAAVSGTVATESQPTP